MFFLFYALMWFNNWGITIERYRLITTIKKIMIEKSTHPNQKQVRIQATRRYIKRLDKFFSRIEVLDKRFFWLRLTTLLLALGGIVLVFIDKIWFVGVILFLASAISFVVVVYFHRKLDRRSARIGWMHDFAQTQLSRMNLDWQGIPTPPPEENAASDTSVHPFGDDLEIIGNRSLQQLLDISTTMGGSRRLKSWLLNRTPSIDQIYSRQAVIRELRSLPGFRGRLALNSALVDGSRGRGWDDSRLLAWINGSKQDPSLIYFLYMLIFLALVNVVLFLLNLFGGYPPIWIFSLGVYGILYNFKYKQYHDLFGDALQLGQNLERFQDLFTYFEKYPYSKNESLRQVCEPYWNSASRPSHFLKKTKIFISAASIKNNQLLWLIVNAILPWDLFFTIQLQRYKQILKGIIPTWLDTWYELEALNSLANFAYLNPGYVFPVVYDVADLSDRGVFNVQKLGHPLLLDEVRICNDFSLERLGEVIIVSGSNMSGKSTFLKTLGVNLSLAYAGSVVTAASLETIMFRIYTSINIVDSLTDGISYFYAEVKRLKQILDAYHEENALPLFYLIDEIFRGTNNKERQIGSRAYLKALVGGNGVGVISTHDLELVHFADEDKRIRNYHFREDVQHGRMNFDYILHPGPCPTTNALKIMALEGLPTE